MKRRLFFAITTLITVFLVGSVTLSTAPPVYAATSSSSSSSSTPSAPSLNCPIFDLSWAFCPVIKAMGAAVESLDNFINSQLSVGTPGDSDDPNQIFCNKNSTGTARTSCDAYYKAWNSIRIIALGLLAVAGLIVLISQALGFEFLDAYTIRKVLPRLLIVSVGITLSWQIMQFFVTLSNDLAFGIRFLIYQPFTGIPDASLGGGSKVVGSLLGLGALTALGWIGLMSYIGTALLAVFIAVLVLILRQLVVIMLIILAPIAIVSYVLPNTQRVYKLWWESFSKALMMFVLIAALIATGRVFAAVAGLNSDNPIAQLAGFAAYFLPYFLIPATFRFAGGALRQIGGFVNDRGRGGFDRLRQYRSGRSKENLQALAAGNRIKASNPLATAFNKTSRGIANAPSAGMTPWKWRSRYQAGASEGSMNAVADYMEKNTAFKAISGNDDYMQAVLKNMGGGDSEDAWRDYLYDEGYRGRALEQGVAGIRAAKRETNDETFKKAAVLANARTGTGWKQGGAGQALESINEAWGDDRDGAIRALAQVRSDTKQNGRQDIGGASFSKSLFTLNDLHEYKKNPSKASKKMTPEMATRDMVKNAWEVNSAGSWVGMRGHALEHMAPVMGDEIEDAYKSKDPVKIDTALAKLANLRDVLNYTTPEGGDILGREIFNRKVENLDGTKAVIRDEIAQRARSSDAYPAYHNVRNEVRQTVEDLQRAGQAGTQIPGQDRLF